MIDEKRLQRWLSGTAYTERQCIDLLVTGWMQDELVPSREDLRDTVILFTDGFNNEENGLTKSLKAGKVQLNERTSLHRWPDGRRFAGGRLGKS